MAIMIIISIPSCYYSIISFNYAHNYMLHQKINYPNVPEYENTPELLDIIIDRDLLPFRI